MKRRPRAGSPSAGDGFVLLSNSRHRLWLAAGIYLACAVAFLADVTHDIAFAFGVFYLPLVCTAVFYRDPRWVWWLAAAATCMVLVGMALPAGHLGFQAVANGALSIAAILATAALLRHERSTQVRLAGETQRAQAADRLKTQIFAGLGNALQTPAQTIIAVADQLAAAIRPEQRNDLEHLRSEAENLLTTIDNLIDLAAATDRLLQLETLDIARIVRDAVDAVRHSAAEKHIWLETGSPPNATAVADSWAVRRIIDNLLANALKFTPGGGHIRVGVEIAAARVTIVVEDTGPGIPSDILLRLGQPFLQAVDHGNAPRSGLGNGLALCRKLADAMGATLAFSGEPGRGTQVRISLPRA